jgi:hypothetical protein
MQRPRKRKNSLNERVLTTMDTRMNVRSMTGYGRGEVEHQGIRILTEIRSMNHRFLDIVVRLAVFGRTGAEMCAKCGEAGKD